jgi:VanZ family protein
MHLVSSEAPQLVPRAWAVNGFFNVIGSVGAMILGMILGLTAVFVTAAACYSNAPLSTRNESVKNLYKLSFWAILVGILIACLWPFHSPRNEVAWAAHGNGLSFGGFGTILSRDIVEPKLRPQERGCTLEIWLRPQYVRQKGTILAFYARQRASGFSLRQANVHFLVVTARWNQEDIPKAQEFEVAEAFLRMRFTLLTLTFGSSGTRAYVNGALVRDAPQFRIPDDDFSGRLIVGNSPVLPDSWSGEIKGFALYVAELTGVEVFRNYEAWTRTGRPETNADPATALYVFDEHSGNLVHNRAGSRSDLLIPKRYMELHHTLLRPPWDEYAPGWDYWMHVLINIAGFVPLGFLCYAYLSSASLSNRPMLLTILLGCLLSLLVETFQAYIPTRDSGLTDVLTNTLGTVVGIALYGFARAALEKFEPSRSAALMTKGDVPS